MKKYSRLSASLAPSQLEQYIPFAQCSAQLFSFLLCLLESQGEEFPYVSVPALEFLPS